jgi:hypothetical protein
LAQGFGTDFQGIIGSVVGFHGLRFETCSQTKPSVTQFMCR